MKITDLIQSKDGSMSLTKVAASTAHLNLAVAFAWLTYQSGFVWEMWALYGSFALGHATFDKTMAITNAFKLKKLEGEKNAQ